MNLIFRKDESFLISITRSVDDNEYDFNYVDMIKDLIKNKKMGEPVVEGEFTEAERESIISMVDNINADAATFHEDNEEENK